MNETPLPGTVFAITTCGLPFSASACSTVSTTAATSFPSHSQTRQLNDSYFSRSGSSGMTVSVEPSI